MFGVSAMFFFFFCYLDFFLQNRLLSLTKDI